MSPWPVIVIAGCSLLIKGECTQTDIKSVRDFQCHGNLFSKHNLGLLASYVKCHAERIIACLASFGAIFANSNTIASHTWSHPDLCNITSAERKK